MLTKSERAKLLQLIEAVEENARLLEHLQSSEPLEALRKYIREEL